MSDQTIYRVTFADGSSCHYGVESLARAAARGTGKVEAVTVHHQHTDNVTALRLCVDQLLHDGVPVDPTHPRRIALDAAETAMHEPVIDIDDRYAGRLALLLECMLIDSNGYWNEAAALLDEYKAEWNRVNPMPTFMGEPMPPERREILRKPREKREAAESERPCTCHPDDNPPTPCARQYTLDACRQKADQDGFEDGCKARRS